MKLILALFFIIISRSIIAQTYTLADLPKSVICQAKSKNEYLKNTFVIENLQGTPFLNNLDARAEGPSDIDSFLTVINANNGCDNNYYIALLTEELVALSKKQKKEVNGVMKFYNSASVCQDEECEYSETATVICYLE